MIENQNQYRTTQEMVKKFKQSLFQVQEKKAKEGESLLLNTYISAFQSQIDDLLEEIKDYEIRLNDK